MITAVQAFEVAHRAIAGKRYYDAPCDVTIDRAGDAYTVTFSTPAVEASAATPTAPTHVVIDAETAVLRTVREAAEPVPEASPRGMISAKQALEVGFTRLRTAGLEYDAYWTTTVALRDGKFIVTFPVSEAMRAYGERPDYALQVWVNPQDGSILKSRRG